MYTLYCFFNDRLISRVEGNNLLCDEQNGFRPGRSCVDHRSTITKISKTKNKYALSGCMDACEKVCDIRRANGADAYKC